MFLQYQFGSLWICPVFKSGLRIPRLYQKTMETLAKRRERASHTLSSWRSAFPTREQPAFYRYPESSSIHQKMNSLHYMSLHWMVSSGLPWVKTVLFRCIDGDTMYAARLNDTRTELPGKKWLENIEVQQSISKIVDYTKLCDPSHLFDSDVDGLPHTARTRTQTSTKNTLTIQPLWFQGRKWQKINVLIFSIHRHSEFDHYPKNPATYLAVERACGTRIRAQWIYPPVTLSLSKLLLW